MVLKCSHCGGILTENDLKCPYCDAPNEALAEYYEDETEFRREQEISEREAEIKRLELEAERERAQADLAQAQNIQSGIESGRKIIRGVRLGCLIPIVIAALVVCFLILSFVFKVFRKEMSVIDGITETPTVETDSQIDLND